MKYPYIATDGFNNFLVYAENTATLVGDEKNCFSNGFKITICESEVTDITREYLANTYGKVESKGHAEFIVKLAESAGIAIPFIQDGFNAYFNFFANSLYFWGDKFKAGSSCEKLITIPLPPKEPESKDWPQVGDDVLYDGKSGRFKSIKGTVSKVIAKYSFDGTDYITINHESEGIFAMVFGSWIKKPKTPEEELRDELIKATDNYRNQELSVQEVIAKAVVNCEIKGLTYKP